MIEDFDNKKIQEFEYTKNINVDGEIIGTCELGTAEFQILNNTNEYSNLKGQWMKTIHGSFYVYDVAPVQEKINIKLSCYDIKYKLDTPYDKSLYSFPMTLKEWRNQIGNNCGVVFDNSDFPNSDLVLDSQPYVGENPSNRNVVQQIAKAGCSFVDNDEKDILYFNWFEDKVYKVDDWIELTTENKSSDSLNVVVLGRGNVEDNVYYPENLSENKVEFRIDNNYILDPQDTETTHDRRYDVIKPIYDRVNGFSYLIFKMRTQKMDNRLSLKLGQKISYSDIWGNQLEAYVMEKTIKYLGGDAAIDSNYEVTLSASEIKESSTDYSYASSVENQILNVSRKADKNAGMIQDMVSKTIDLVENIHETGKVEMKSTFDTTEFVLRIRNACQYFKSKWLFKSKTKFLKGSWLRVTYEDKTYERYKLPPLSLRQLNGTYDEMVIQSGKISVIKRVGIDENNTLYLLPEEKVITYDDILIQLKNGTNTIQLESFPEAVFDMTYMTDNLYTNTFATSAEVQALLEITVGRIMLEVSSKTSEEEVKSLINISLNDIKLELTKKIGETEAQSLIDIALEDIRLELSKKIGEERVNTLIEAAINEYKLVVSKEIEDSSDALSEDLNKKITENSEDIDNLNTNLSGKIDETKANELINDKTKNFIDETKANELIENKTSPLEESINKVDTKYKESVDNINEEMGTKIGQDDYTAAIIIGKINNDKSELLISADKVNLLATDILNILAKNTINLTSKDITIESNNFSLTKDGNVTIKDIADAVNNSGNLKIQSSKDINQYVNHNSYWSEYKQNGLDSTIGAGFLNLYDESTGPYSLNGSIFLDGSTGEINVNSDLGTGTAISSAGIETPKLTQTSLLKYKKEIEKFKNALEIIDNIDLYKYNLKNEKKGDKKHIGIVIGENYKYSPEITSVDKDGKEIGVDLYSLASLDLQAIKELYQLVKKQQSEINQLKEEVNLLNLKIKEMEENRL